LQFYITLTSSLILRHGDIEGNDICWWQENLVATIPSVLHLREIYHDLTEQIFNVLRSLVTVETPSTEVAPVSFRKHLVLQLLSLSYVGVSGDRCRRV
jgi:hypothetical protein